MKMKTKIKSATPKCKFEGPLSICGFSVASRRKEAKTCTSQ